MIYNNCKYVNHTVLIEMKLKIYKGEDVPKLGVVLLMASSCDSQSQNQICRVRAAEEL